jgi:hypothetical protein
MNSQEYHSLQEAYMNVYQEVDEAVYGGEQKKPEAPKDKRLVVTNADKKGNTPAYQNLMKGDKRYKAADHMGEETRELDEVRGGGRIDPVSDFPHHGERARSPKDAGLKMSPLDRAEARANALKKRNDPKATKRANRISSRFIGPTKRGIGRAIDASNAARSAEKRRLQALNNSYDLFDVILSHLLAEGYADTNENALVIMANMSEEWRESVISEMPFQVTGPDPRSSDPNSPHVSIGKPYQSKKRAKTEADKLDAEIGGYRHKVKYVA